MHLQSALIDQLLGFNCIGSLQAHNDGDVDVAKVLVCLDHTGSNPVAAYNSTKDIVAYAKAKAINVIPEIEMPGHSDEVLAAYPNLACDNVKGRTGEFCIGNDSTFTFMQDVLTEVMGLFPSKYIHIGGDEAAKGHWKKCTKCQKRITDNNLKDEDELQSYAIKRMEIQ